MSPKPSDQFIKEGLLLTVFQNSDSYSMLQDFKVLQCRHSNGTPMCMALFCIDASPQPFPYAWVDTIKSPDKLTVTVIDQAREFDRTRVVDTITKLVNKEATLDNLRTFMIDKAEQKLATRQGYFDKQKRLYAKTNYAAQDAAFACRPSYATKRLQESLARVRANMSDDIALVDDGMTMEGFERAPRPWMWKDYDEPTLLIESLLARCHGKLTPLPVTLWERHFELNGIAQDVREAHCKHAIGDRRRWRTPKSKITYLLSQVGSLKYLVTTSSYFADVPCPIEYMQPDELAQSPELLDLLVETENWISQGFLFNHPLVTDRVNKSEDPFQYRMKLDCLKLMGNHSLEDGKIMMIKPFVDTFAKANYFCAQLVEEYDIKKIHKNLRSYMDHDYPRHKEALAGMKLSEIADES